MTEINFIKTFEGKIIELEKDGLLKLTNTHCALTPKGMAYLDSIAVMLTRQDFS
jgi:ribosomal protein S19E (S16A)